MYFLITRQMSHIEESDISIIFDRLQGDVNDVHFIIYLLKRYPRPSPTIGQLEFFAEMFGEGHYQEIIQNWFYNLPSLEVFIEFEQVGSCPFHAYVLFRASVASFVNKLYAQSHTLSELCHKMIFSMMPSNFMVHIIKHDDILEFIVPVSIPLCNMTIASQCAYELFAHLTNHFINCPEIIHKSSVPLMRKCHIPSFKYLVTLGMQDGYDTLKITFVENQSNFSGLRSDFVDMLKPHIPSDGIIPSDVALNIF